MTDDDLAQLERLFGLLATHGITLMPENTQPRPIHPSLPVPTVRVASDATALGYLTINASDFDPAVHEEYDPAEEHEGEPDLPDVGDDLAALSFQQLRDKAKELGLSARGTKADLQLAIGEKLVADAAAADAAAAHQAAGEGAEA
jgi:hypothetical protein